MNNKKIVSVIAVLLALLMALSLVFSVVPVSAYADELDDLQAQKNDLSNQVKECQERLTLLKEQQSNVLEQKAALDEQNKLANEQLELVAKEIDEYTKLIAEKAEEVEAARTKEERQLALYQARVRAMEESGGFNILAVIVNSQNFSQLLTAIDDMSEIMASDRELQEQYVEAREETEAVKAEYEAEKAEYEEAQAQLEEERAEIGRQIQANTQELEDRWPGLTPKEREDAWLKDHPTAFVMQIGGPLKSGGKHDGRAPDYDDWTMNGDILFWNSTLGHAFEVSSMGIRVDADRMRIQCEAAGCPERLALPFHKGVLDGTLPLTMGGGIGQSRLCMLLLGKAHIGEVQVSLWPEDMIRACAQEGIQLL